MIDILYFHHLNNDINLYLSLFMLIKQVNWKTGPEVFGRLHVKHVILVQLKLYCSERQKWPEDGSFELKMTENLIFRPFVLIEAC